MAGTRATRRRNRGTGWNSDRSSGRRRVKGRAGPRLESPAGDAVRESPMNAPASEFRSGFVSILGRPNAGKSTFLNAMVGGKLAIVSEKPQTTRTSIEGVLNLDNAQIVFVDTPGIHKSTTLLNQRMMGTVRAAVEDRDVLLYLADV